MKKVEEWEGPLVDLLKDYRYQPDLTVYLDALGHQPFGQDVVNEIVLWKVDRYAKLSPSDLDALNRVVDTPPKSHRTAKAGLATLLRAPGVDLAMASALLRFRNKSAFQIIDRHAYRAVYGEDYPLYSSSSDDSKIEIYFRYLDALFELAESRKVDFETLDRVLYIFDKQFNGKL